MSSAVIGSLFTTRTICWARAAPVMIRTALSSTIATDKCAPRVKRLENMVAPSRRRFVRLDWDQRIPETPDAPLLSAETPWLLVLPPSVRKVSCIMKVWLVAKLPL